MVSNIHSVRYVKGRCHIVINTTKEKVLKYRGVTNNVENFSGVRTQLVELRGVSILGSNHASGNIGKKILILT